VIVPPLPAEGELPEGEARQLGHQLAAHPLLAAHPGDARPPVSEVLTDARPLLGTYGIAFEVVRSRPGCVVVRATPGGSLGRRSACELVRTLVTDVAEQVCGLRAALVENTCVQRGAAACIYSVVWEPEDAATTPLPAAPPGPETLIDPEPEFAAFEPSVPPLPVWDAPRHDRGHGPVNGRGPHSPASPSGPAQTAEAPPVPNAATPTTYHFQSTPSGAVVTPRPAPPPPSAQPEPGGQHASPPPPPPAAVGPNPARRLPRALIRRSWLVALALVAGTGGGWFAGRHAPTSYVAQATVVVRSGSGVNGPGNANDAMALATTYAALIPKDQSILSVAARTLGTSPSTISHGLSVSVENGTSIVVLDYWAPTARRALAGVRAVTGAVASTRPVSSAIGPGSVAVVNEPSTAHRQGTLHRYGAIIGGLLGVLVGVVLVVAAERADPRIDDPATLAHATGCRAATVPAGLSHAELARVLAEVGRVSGQLTMVPLAIADTNRTMELARQLRPFWPSDGPAVEISPAFQSGVVELTRRSGPTVLVSHPGSRLREARAAAQRLRTIGRTPQWAILVGRGRAGAVRHAD
jgi:capsular polysaccharide biosynthesis protein